MDNDLSQGWEAVAGRFIECRSDIGVDVVREWAGCLPRGGTILDLGCGSGMPIAQALVDDGFAVAGIDASKTLADAFRMRFPHALVACEAAEQSRFFDRQFDGVIAIGLLFLLPEEAQRTLLGRVTGALKSGGHFLFSAPERSCTWDDLLTGRRSASLGAAEYRRVLEAVGLALLGGRADKGGNHYYEALKRA